MNEKNIRNFSIIAHIDHGKSTLADRLLEKCNAVSAREMSDQILDNMDLERERGITIKARAVTFDYTAADGEVYTLNLIDTPGHVDFNYEVSRSLAACEGALLVVDASQGIEAQTLANTYLAMEHDLEIRPVLNKIDLLPKESLLALMQRYQAAGYDDIVPISAAKGDGVEELKQLLISYLPEGPQYFPADAVTDQPERLICAELIREKALLHLREEVPHGIGVEMMAMNKLSDNLMEIHATIYCERAAHKGIIIGKQGAMLKQIGQEARQDIETLLGMHVHLQLWVKVRENWRNRMDDLRTLGYEDKE